ncbi:hypothetical protein PLCT2_02533 [Planctomycetaceae bacterium]|nr:hypothetical protein PLCT2_02533 [Planctomycetaceae bacterium]
MAEQRLVSIVLCEDVLFDLDHNLTIYRVFRRVSSAQFPAVMRRLHVVTTWLGEGLVMQRVLILSPDKAEVLYDCTGRVNLAGTWPVPYVNRAHWLVWPEPGIYWLRVLNGTLAIGEDLPILIEQTSAPNAPPQQEEQI